MLEQTWLSLHTCCFIHAEYINGKTPNAEVKQEQPEHVEPAKSALTRALLAFAVVVLFLSYLGSRLG